MQNLITLIKKLSAELGQLRNTNQGLRERACQLDDSFVPGDVQEQHYLANETRQ